MNSLFVTLATMCFTVPILTYCVHPCVQELYRKVCRLERASDAPDPASLTSSVSSQKGAYFAAVNPTLCEGTHVYVCLFATCVILQVVLLFP